jgi:hypothetical protein
VSLLSSDLGNRSLQINETALMNEPLAGRPDWANFRLLGDCYHGAVDFTYNDRTNPIVGLLFSTVRVIN